MISVRRLTAREPLQAAIGLLQRFFREEGFDTPDAVIAERARVLAGLEACGLFLAEAEGEAIGVATVSLEYGIEFGWSAELGDLYVLPAWRGRGASRALVAAVEALLVDKGAAGYQVTVTPFGAEAHDLASYYQALGFAGEGRMLLYKHLPRSQD